MKIKTKKAEASQNNNFSNFLLNPGSSSEIKDSYIKLRTNLMFCKKKGSEESCKVFAVSAANKAEGKSITAANIAISFAMLGKKTILIDADMRSSSQRKLWKNRSQAGLCDFLAKVMPLEIYSVEDLPLSIVFTGTLPYNPAELVSSKKMMDFVKECSEHYDYVIIDTPALNAYADAQIVSTYVDGVILVSKSGVTSSKDLNEAIETLEHSNGNLCGIVVNNIKDKKTSFFNFNKVKIG